jgi:hypothetical protein
VPSLVDFSPLSVYHYTTAAGFAGIVQAGGGRATNFTFLNDPSEVQYGSELVRDLVREVKSSAEPRHRRLLEAVIVALDQELLSEVYVCCFSSLPDDLSQWRAYGGPALERYSIGFDTEALWTIGNTDAMTSFAEVLYTHEAQRDRVRFYVERGMEFIDKYEIPEEDWPTVTADVAELLARVIPQLKNTAYAREEEWRVIRRHRVTDAEPLSFDVSRGVLRPYLPIELPTPMPITSVQLMAPSRKQVALKGAEMLLRSASLDVVPTHSAVPFAE